MRALITSGMPAASPAARAAATTAACSSAGHSPPAASESSRLHPTAPASSAPSTVMRTSPYPRSRSAVTGSSVARATTPTASSIASRDTTSPSASPRAAAIDQLAVASARHPAAPATTRALAASHTFTSTNGSGAACNRRSSSAFSRCVLMPSQPKGDSPLNVPFRFSRPALLNGDSPRLAPL